MGNRKEGQEGISKALKAGSGDQERVDKRPARERDFNGSGAVIFGKQESRNDQIKGGVLNKD